MAPPFWDSPGAQGSGHPLRMASTLWPLFLLFVWSAYGHQLVQRGNNEVPKENGELLLRTYKSRIPDDVNHQRTIFDHISSSSSAWKQRTRSWWNDKKSRGNPLRRPRRFRRKKRDVQFDPWRNLGDEKENFNMDDEDILYVEGGDYEVKTSYVSTTTVAPSTTTNATGTTTTAPPPTTSPFAFTSTRSSSKDEEHVVSTSKSKAPSITPAMMPVSVVEPMIFLSNQTRKATMKPKKKHQTTMDMEKPATVTKKTITETTKNIATPEDDVEEDTSPKTLITTTESQKAEVRSQEQTSVATDDIMSTTTSKEEEEDISEETSDKDSTTHKFIPSIRDSATTTATVKASSPSIFTQTSAPVSPEVDMRSTTMNIADLSTETVSPTAEIDASTDATQSKSSTGIGIKVISTVSPAAETVPPVTKLQESTVTTNTGPSQTAKISDATVTEKVQELSSSASAVTQKAVEIEVTNNMTTEKVVTSTSESGDVTSQMKTTKISPAPVELTTPTVMMSKEEIEGDVTTVASVASSDSTTSPEIKRVTSDASIATDGVVTQLPDVGEPAYSASQRTKTQTSSPATPDRETRTADMTAPDEDANTTVAAASSTSPTVDEYDSTAAPIKQDLTTKSKLRDVTVTQTATQAQDAFTATAAAQTRRPSPKTDSQASTTVDSEEELSTTASAKVDEYSDAPGFSTKSSSITTTRPVPEDVTETKESEKVNKTMTSADIKSVETMTPESSDTTTAAPAPQSTSAVGVTKLDTAINTSTPSGSTPSSKATTEIKKLLEEDSTTKSFELSTPPAEKKNETYVTTLKSVEVSATSQWSQSTSLGTVSASQQIAETATSPSSTSSIFVTTTSPRPKRPETGVRWIQREFGPFFCNKECFPYLASANYVCVSGVEKFPVNQRLCDPRDIPCGKSFVCSKTRKCGSWNVHQTLTNCNASCGFGTQLKTFVCKINETTVHDAQCLDSAKPKRVQPCLVRPCGRIFWIFSRWSKCVGTTCQGVRTRIVACRDSKGNLVPDDFCTRESGVPARTEMCMKTNCEQDFWYKGEWSKCSAECGSGITKREVVCVRRVNSRFEISGRCDHRKRPSVIKKCDGPKKVCPFWFASIRWNAPSTCLPNCKRTRRVFCINGTRIVAPSFCAPDRRPLSKMPCECLRERSPNLKAPYLEEEKDIRLSAEEILSRNLYWVCPPQSNDITEENHVWVKVEKEKHIVYNQLQKRSMEIKRSVDGNRLILQLRKGAQVPQDLTGHYVCVAYNSSQNMWDGKMYHRTLFYYQTTFLIMSSANTRHNVAAGRIIRLACQLDSSGDEAKIEWYRNGERLPNIKGGDYQEFLSSVGSNRFECRRGTTRLSTVINVEPMTVDGCAAQPYGCCSKGLVPAMSQLHTKCNEGNPLPCKTSRYGCCPKSKKAAIGWQHLACPGRYVHPSRCSADAQRFRNAIKQCANRNKKRNFIGQLRYHIDVTSKRCLPFVVDVECESVKPIPLFESVDSCRKHCVNVKKIERCFLHHTRVSNEKNCPAPKRMWYFDIFTKECLFVRDFRECLLNTNRFLSSTECLRECKYPAHTRNADECFEPKAEGTCRKQYGYERFYYFNYAKGKCQKFLFNGCHGTLNRFTSLRDCEKRCAGKATPKKMKKVCSMARNIGHCPLVPVHVRRWYHDSRDGTCKEMQYSQCGGNGNNFETQRDCTEACGAKMPVDVCTLPVNKGDCPAGRELRRYRFDEAAMRCRPFQFSGCGGNANNFLTLRACNEACLLRSTTVPLPPPVKPRVPVDTQRLLDYEPCQQAQSLGNCRSTAVGRPKSRRGVDRWYFNVREGTCQSFRYSGCGGSANIFDTRFVCERKCQERLRQVPRKCKRRLRGSCLGKVGDTPIFTYDMALGRCIQKHLNHQCKSRSGKYFESVEACEKECRPPPPIDDHVSDVCFVTPQSYSQCPDYQKVQRWHFSVKDNRCVTYITCPYTKYFGNSHANISDCRRFCRSSYIRDVCLLPSDPGLCYANKPQRMFAYNAKARKCEELWYNGCLGNKNRFVTLEECRSVCDAEMKMTISVYPTPIKPKISVIEHRPEYPFYMKKKMKICSVPFTSQHVGSCKDDSNVMERWFFKNGQCHRFHYYGCGALINYFETRFDCEDNCVRHPDDTETTALVAQTVCHLPRFEGQCRQKTLRWFSDGLTGKCKSFLGCAGISNSFSSENECLRTCYPTRKLDICRLPKDSGPCNTPTLRWYYDTDSRQCKKFIYNGCHGNSNRFVTKLECEFSCYRSDPCRLGYDVGDTIQNEWVQRYYYNTTTKQCSHFWYAGSAGNPNRFELLSACKATCEIPQAPVAPPASRDQTFTCLQPLWEDSPCEGATRRTKIYAYYNAGTKRCENKKFHLCNGRSLFGNRFESLDVCREQCEEEKVLTDSDKARCQVDKPIAKFCSNWVLNWFFNRKTEQCEKFWHGQCHHEGLENRFATKEECEKSCLSRQSGTTLEPYATIKVQLFDQTTIDPECPSCSNYCSYGYIVMGTCTTCECYDPCKGHKCPTDQECRVECAEEDEKCRPRCVSDVKPGRCPRLPAAKLSDARCTQECLTDTNCRGNARCCAVKTDKCDRVSACLTPVLTNRPIEADDWQDCRRGPFGCCPDSQKAANSSDLSLCPPVKPRSLFEGARKVTAIVLSSVTLMCNITAAPKAEIEWFHEGKRIPFGANVVYRRFLKKDYKLKISPVQRVDFGTWRCVGKNEHGSASHDVYVSLIEAASLVRMSPKRLQVEENRSVILRCIAQGIPTPMVHWTFSSTIDGPKRVLLVNNSTYVVPRVTRATEGFYFCETDNGIRIASRRASSQSRHRIHLVVKRPLSAEITVYPSLRKVMEGGPMRLRCRVRQASPGTRVLWFRQGSVITASNVTYPRRKYSSISVRAAQMSDAGKYTCMLSDDYGDTKYYSTYIHVYRDSSQLPRLCQDDLNNCFGLVESLGHERKRSCKGSVFEERCCRTCYELGKLTFLDVVDLLKRRKKPQVFKKVQE